jgi:hypothetical protein
MRPFGAYDIYSCTGLFDETKRSEDERRLSSVKIGPPFTASEDLTLSIVLRQQIGISSLRCDTDA